MPLYTRTAKTFENIFKLLFSDTFNTSINRYRSTFAYRGVSDANYELSNGLSRFSNYYQNLEKNLIKQFKKYLYPDVIEKENEWHLLSVAQHHGLPTRLLDWTYSPLVALHFSTCNLDDYSKDGAVWRIDYSAVHDLLQKKYLDQLNKLGSRIFSIDVLTAAIKDLDALDKEGSSHGDVAVFFEPPSINSRIINQFAYFSALSDPIMSVNDWIKLPHVRKNVKLWKIIIPHSLKWEIRDKLDQSNVNERVLFPGLDGLSNWLKRHYKQR